MLSAVNFFCRSYISHQSPIYIRKDFRIDALYDPVFIIICYYPKQFLPLIAQNNSTQHIKQRQQALLLAAVVDCDRKYVPNNVYDSYLRVMMELMSPVSNPAPGVRPGIKLVEPRGVEPLSESAFTVTSPGAVCLFGIPAAIRRQTGLPFW